MELSPAAMETVNQVLAKQLKEGYRALSIQLQPQLDQLKERIKGMDKLKRKRVRSTSTSNISQPGELRKSDFTKDLKPATSTVKEKAKIDFKTKNCTSTSHTRCFICQGKGHYSRDCPNKKKLLLQDGGEIVTANSSASEFNELYEPDMSTFKFDFEEALARIKSTRHNAPLTSVKAKCDISSMQSDFVLNTLTPEEPVQPSSMILVPQDLERKSVEEAPMNSPMTTNLENKRCKTPERERNQLPSVISFISPKEVPPDKAYQGIHDTKVSLSCELVNYWNNFTYARVIKQPVLNIEISRIMDLIFSISAKKDTGRFDVCKTLTRTGAIMSLKESQCGERQVTAELIHWRKTNLDPGDGIFKRKEVHRSSSIQAFANQFGPKTWSYLKQHELEPGGDKPFQLLKRLIKPINPTHFIQVSISLSHFVSPDLRVGNMSLFHPKSIKKKLGLFVGRLKQYSYLNMLKEELDDKDNYLDRNEIPLLVYRYSMTAIMHLFLAKGIAYFADVKEEPPDLFSITVFTRTGIGVDLTRSNTDLRTNLSQEGGDDMILAGQKREVSSEPELEGRIELRRCLKQFIRLLQQVYSSFRAVKSSTFLPWRLHLVMITE